jgi:hypothetical protein
MEIDDDIIRSLIANLKDARERRDEAGAVIATLALLERVGIPDDLLAPLNAVFERLMTEQCKKLYGNRSLPPHVVFKRAMDTAKVIVMCKLCGVASQGDALKKLGRTGDAAKEITDFIDNWQRGRLNKLAMGYLNRAIDHVILEWTPPEHRVAAAEFIRKTREAILNRDDM